MNFKLNCTKPSYNIIGQTTTKNVKFQLLFRKEDTAESALKCLISLKPSTSPCSTREVIAQLSALR